MDTNGNIRELSATESLNPGEIEVSSLDGTNLPTLLNRSPRLRRVYYRAIRQNLGRFFATACVEAEIRSILAYRSKRNGR